MSYLTHPSSHPDFDQWSGDEPDPAAQPSGSGHAYRCMDCAWCSKGAAAYDHHLAHRDHRIVLRHAPHLGPVVFGCCHQNTTPVIIEKDPVL